MAVAGFSVTSRAGETSPNVLLISIDDLNDWTGCLSGHPQPKTPNIDRLAARGTLFTNAHCQSPVCNPSRASLLTGRHPHSSGVYFLAPDLKQAPQSRSNGDFTDFVDFAVFLSIWGQSYRNDYF